MSRPGREGDGGDETPCADRDETRERVRRVVDEQLGQRPRVVVDRYMRVLGVASSADEAARVAAEGSPG